MTNRYWASVSEDHLLSVDLTTDDPEQLENYTLAVPDGPDESFVEYGYNLKGLERDKIRCAHCHQPHLAGVIVNKGGLRFPVGHICGAHIYGVDFTALKKDYDAAVIKQGTLRRVREIRAVVDPFLEWLDQFSSSPVFRLREELLHLLKSKMPWLWEQLQWHTNSAGGSLNGVKLPDTLFDGFTDPHRGFKELAAEISRLAMLVVGKIEIEKDVSGTLGRLQVLIGQVEQVVRQLDEVEQFFQPAIFGAVCEWATQQDRKRKYEAGLMKITCIRDKGPAVVQVPSAYKVPDTGPIAACRAAVSNLPSKQSRT